VGVAPQPRRSARDYEEELRRRELAVGRALLQVLPADQPVGVRQLAEARRVLANALRDLRHLQRQVEADIQQLRTRATGASRGAAPAQRGSQPASNGAQGASRPQPAARLPRELPGYEAARNAMEDVIARWEAREAQLDAEVQRRGGRKPPAGAEARRGARRPQAGGEGQRRAARKPRR
jgi:uncharacterized protein involved in exopolysaccharide biosynthesis